MPVVTLDITHHSPFMEGRPFGDVGPYQLLEGVVHFAIDPLHPCNAAITDIELAPRDATGKVGFASQDGNSTTIAYPGHMSTCAACRRKISASKQTPMSLNSRNMSPV